MVTEEDSFMCPGYVMVEGRRIRCAKVAGHGPETFVQGTMNSCNPVFIDVGDEDVRVEGIINILPSSD